MKNIVFISPNFPTNYWMFCQELKNNGMNVLGIGDQPFDELTPEQKNSLTEYYKVDSLEDDDAVYRAIAFFTFKYGRIDWLESNNEYWLERDARFRTDYNIKSGFQIEDIPRIKYKSHMKEYYKKANVPTARYHLVDTIEECKKFIDVVGYPVCVKPDNGVGASHTFRLESDTDLGQFFAEKYPETQYIMEEYIFGEVNSYDAIIDSNGDPIFETGNVTPLSIMDIVNTQDDSIFYILKSLPKDTRKYGRAVVKAFNVKNRFVHFEFFRLDRDQEGLGKKGELVGLEVNMRPCGGISPDMMNFANSTNVYKIWADMIAFDRTDMEPGEHSFCAFVGRRDGHDYAMNHEQILEKYGENLKSFGRVSEALSGAMGNQMYIATFPTKAKLNAFYKATLKCKNKK